MQTSRSNVLRVLAALVVTGLVACQARGDGEGPAAPDGSPGRAAAFGWEVVYAGAGIEGEITDVAATAPDSAWAIGTREAAEPTPTRTTDPLLLRLVGGAWRPVDLPAGLPADVHLQDVEASGPDNVWLFGTGGATGAAEQQVFALRWDGGGWRRMPLPDRTRLGFGNPGSPFAVLGPDDVWAPGADGTHVQHWDGTAWNRVRTPAAVASMAALAADEVWAVGHRDTGGEPLSQPAAMRWDGIRWTLVATPEYRFPDPAPPEETASLGTVLAVAEDEVWALGEHTFNHGEGGPEPTAGSILLRWDGTEWTRAPKHFGAKLDSLRSFASDGDGGLLNDTWHLGRAGAATRIAAPEPVPGRTGKVTAVDRKQKFRASAVVRVPGSDEVWAVGEAGLSTKGDANFSRPVVVRLDRP